MFYHFEYILNLDLFDLILGHSLYCVGSLQDIELYIPNGADKSEFLSQSHRVQLTRFVNILKDLVEVFELAPKAIHIFFDNNSTSIAFNRDKALFFNFKFYLGLHDEQCKNRTTSDAMTYWYMTFCHELAHNFVSPHNSEHEVSIIKFLFLNIIFNLINPNYASFFNSTISHRLRKIICQISLL